jgi:hypothetical protein
MAHLDKGLDQVSVGITTKGAGREEVTGLSDTAIVGYHVSL